MRRRGLLAFVFRILIQQVRVPGAVVSVDSIEKQTGYDLLSNVPQSAQKVIEDGVDMTML